MRRAAFRRWLTGVKRVTAAENEGGPGPVGATAEAILPADTQITDLDWAKQENLQHLARSPDSLDATPICCQNRQHDSKTDHPFQGYFSGRRPDGNGGLEVGRTGPPMQPPLQVPLGVRRKRREDYRLRQRTWQGRPLPRRRKRASLYFYRCGSADRGFYRGVERWRNAR